VETKGLKALRIGLASPEVIRSWSYGEVLKPETINYRRYVLRRTAYFVKPFLAQHEIISVIVGSIRIPAIKALYATNVMLR